MEFLSTILGPIFKIIDKAIPDQTKAMELKAEIERMTLENKAEVQKTMREIAVSEIQGNRFQSSWRPLLSYMVIFLAFWIFFLKGVLEAVFSVSISSGTSGDLITIMTVWSAVYGLGRSFEKSGSTIKVGQE